MKRAEWRQMERCQSIHIELILGGRASFLRTRYCVTSLTVSAAFSSLPTTLLFHEQLIGVTPSPAFPWFNRADDGMAGRAKWFRAPFHFLKFRMSPFFSRYFLAQRESAL